MTGPSNREVDIVTGAIFAVLGVYILYLSLRLEFYSEGVPGPGFFPSVLAIALIVSGALLIVTRLRTSREEAGHFDAPSRSQTRRSLGLWGIILVTTLLIEVVGFVVAMLLMVAAILLGLEGRRGISTIVTVVVTPLLAYLLFGWLLQVPLPTGVFGS
jgi:putative tricarboxylic transport membrane protein